MNLRQKSSRYCAAVLFAAGVAGAFLIAATLRSGFRPDIEIWLAAALVVTLILHARAGFALSRAQQEIELLHGLVGRFRPSSAKAPPTLEFEPVSTDDEEDAKALDCVKEAIESDRVDLYLQPIVSLPQRKTRYFEAFSRLRRADGGVIKPADYVDAAERANRIGLIDNMILLRAVQSLRNLGPASSHYRVFCNISPATIYDVDFFTRFTDYLDANEDLAQRLVFEFTYPAVEIMHDRVKKNLRLVADRGFSFSVDHVRRFDLNWSALREQNFRYVKASGALLLSESCKGDVGHQRIKAFKKALLENEIDLIVEKVEYEEQMPEITKLGIDFGQGSLFGQPRIASDYLHQTDASGGAAELAAAS